MSAPGPIILDDSTGFYTEQNPELHRMSVEWSNAIHSDPTPSHVLTVMDTAFRSVADHYRSREPYSARLAAARLVRGAVARVVAHRAAMRLAPVATSLLRGDARVIREIVNDPVLEVVKSPTAGIRTDFARVWFGDDARLLLVMQLLTHRAAVDTVDRLPVGIAAGVLRAGIWVTRAGNALVEHRGLEDKKAQLRVDGRWSEEPRGNFVVDASGERVKWNDSFLVDVLASSIKTTTEEFLLHNVEATSEHVVALLTDSLHSFTQHGEATTSDRLRSVISSLHLASALAFMGNRQNGEAEYKDRYIWTDQDDRGRRVSPRQPMVLVVRRGLRYALVPNPKSDYARSSRARRNQCPGPDALRPLGRETDVSANLREAMKAIVADDETAVRLLDRDYSMIDVVTAMAVAAAGHLMESGFATFTDVEAHLKPPGSIRSTGSRILETARL